MSSIKKCLSFVLCFILISGFVPSTVEATTIKLNKSKLIMVKGSTYQLKLNSTKSDVKWLSSKNNIATVTSKGVVTGRKNGKANISATVGSKKYTCEVTVTILDTEEKIEEYIYQRYATLKTDLGTFKLLERDESFGDILCLQVEENEKVSYPYDYRILIRWHAMLEDEPVQWRYNDILESIKYTDEQKRKFKNTFKNYQKRMALDLMNVLPNKKILGGFVTDGYEYPYSKVGWYENLYMSWRNYDVDDIMDYEYGDYFKSTISDFQWND